jgi:hypothetical protein
MTQSYLVGLSQFEELLAFFFSDAELELQLSQDRLEVLEAQRSGSSQLSKGFLFCRFE